MLLLVVDGASQNETVINHSPFTIGRLPDRDLVLSYPYISRAHAEIVYEGDKFYLVDLRFAKRLLRKRDKGRTAGSQE